MDGISDHRLVQLHTNITLEPPDDEYSKNDLPPMAKFNFGRVNQPRLRNALKQKNLLDIVRQASDPTAAMKALTPL